MKRGIPALLGNNVYFSPLSSHLSNTRTSKCRRSLGNQLLSKTLAIKKWAEEAKRFNLPTKSTLPII